MPKTKSIAELTYEECKKMSKDFTCSDIYAQVKKRLPNISLRSNVIANYVSYVGVKKGLIEKIGNSGKSGIYRYVRKPTPDHDKKTTVSMEELGSAIYDYIESLKIKIQDLGKHLSETEKKYKQQVTDKEETIRLLNQRIQQLDKPPEAPTRTFKLGELTTFKPQKRAII